MDSGNCLSELEFQEQQCTKLTAASSCPVELHLANLPPVLVSSSTTDRNVRQLQVLGENQVMRMLGLRLLFPAEDVFIQLISSPCLTHPIALHLGMFSATTLYLALV
jgi:hypothetical protein